MSKLSESEQLSRAINLLWYISVELEEEDSNIGLSYRMELVLDRLNKWVEEQK